MSVTTTGVNHYAVSVRSLEEAIDWYERVLGFRFLCVNTIPGIHVRVAHMEYPGMVLELFDVEESQDLPEYRKYPNEDMKVQGNKHFSLSVPDRERAKAELEELGINIVMTADVWNTYGIFIQDPTGNLIELFEGDMREAS